VDDLLHVDPDCRRMLAVLKHTSALLHALPVHKVPRNFTLSAESKPQTFIPSFGGVFRFSSFAAGLLLVAAVALDLLLRPSPQMAAKAGEEIQLSAQGLEEASTDAADETPMIIYWGAPVSLMGAYGKGGAGVEGIGMGAGGNGLGFYGVGGGEAEPLAAPADLLPSENAPLVEESAEAGALLAESEADAQLPAVKMPAEANPVPKPLSGSGPILGVREPDDRTAEEMANESQVIEQTIARPFPFRLIEIILAVLLVVTAIPAWLLRKR
jgi:hypothetical protein